MLCYVIYEFPTDYPNHFVVRKWVNDEPDEHAWLADNLADARKLVPDGLYPTAKAER
jgi:hypothetical protein